MRTEYLVEVETPRGCYAWPYGQSLQEVFDYLRNERFDPRTDKARVRLNQVWDNTEDLIWYFGHA